MSLILDALARAERDKQRAASPLPDLLQDSAIESGPDRRGLWLAIGVLGAVVLVLAVLYFRALRPASEPGQGSLGRTVNEEAPTRPAITAVAAGTPRTLANPVPTAAEMPPRNLSAPSGVNESTAPRESGAATAGAPQRSAGKAPESVAALYSQDAVQPPTGNEARTQRAAAPAQEPPTSPGETPTEPDVGSGRSAAVVARARETAPAAEPLSAERIEEAIDIDAVLRDVRAEAAAGALQPHSAPLLAELSQQFRDEVPTLMYLRHDFNPAGVSTVLLNGETLREGGRTRGVEVREILADSTVLLFRGQEFRLRALNSWVNL